MKHLTVRMAWHDHGWDGTICADPKSNSYCTGSHSLLSERLGRDKRVDIEAANQGKPLDGLLPDYLPPCYYTSCAFADRKTSVIHAHPFLKLRDTIRFDDELPPHSVFTWPFRLAMTHSKEASKRHGKYHPAIEDRIGRYLEAIS